MIVKLNVLITDKDKKKTFLYLTVQLFSPSVTSIMNFFKFEDLNNFIQRKRADYSLHGWL